MGSPKEEGEILSLLILAPTTPPFLSFPCRRPHETCCRSCCRPSYATPSLPLSALSRFIAHLIWVCNREREGGGGNGPMRMDGCNPLDCRPSSQSTRPAHSDGHSLWQQHFQEACCSMHKAQFLVRRNLQDNFMQKFSRSMCMRQAPFKRFVISPEENLANKEPTAADKEVWQI